VIAKHEDRAGIDHLLLGAHELLEKIAAIGVTYS